MSKISILNAFGYTNKGDAGIILGMINSLSKYFGRNVKFLLESWSYKIDRKVYPALVKGSLWNFPTAVYLTTKSGLPIPLIQFNLIEGLRKIPVLIDVKYNKRITWTKMLLFDEEREFISFLWDSNIILSCGGGFLHDLEGSTHFLRHLYSLYLSTLLPVPTMIYAQSIGPFRNKKYEKVTRKILNKINFITVRDYYSKKYLQKMGVKTPTVVTADAAFNLPSASRKELEKYLESYCWIKENTFNVGITVREWNLSKTARNSYIKAIVTVIKYLMAKYDATVTFFPQTLSDIPLSRKISYIVDSGKVHVISDNLHPSVLKSLMGEMDIFIGTRMHSTIFSMSMFVPSISIAYMPKSQDLMKRVKLKALLIDIYKCSSDLLLEKIKYALLNEDDIRTTLKSEIPKLIKLSLKNAKYAYLLSKTIEK